MDRLEPALHTHELARTCTRTHAHAAYLDRTHETHADATDARAATRSSAPAGRSGVDYCANDSMTSHSREFTAVFAFAMARYRDDQAQDQAQDPHVRALRNNVFLSSESTKSTVTSTKVTLRAIGAMCRLTSTVSYREACASKVSRVDARHLTHKEIRPTIVY